MDKSIECIVKARDDRTIPGSVTKSYLYSMMLSHIEQLEGNVYNFKFIGRMVSSKTTDEIYMNMQVLINDPSVVSNSKYYIKDPTRSEYVKSYNFEGKEDSYNSYRIDMSINTSNEDSEFFIMEIVNQDTNTSNYIHITLEMFFKVSIFIYNMLDNNIIDGDIFLKKINKFRLLSPTIESYNLMREVEYKIFTIYWNQHFILFYLNKFDSSNQITYCIYTKEQFDQIKYYIGANGYDTTSNTGVNNTT